MDFLRSVSKSVKIVCNSALFQTHLVEAGKQRLPSNFYKINNAWCVLLFVAVSFIQEQQQSCHRQYALSGLFYCNNHLPNGRGYISRYSCLKIKGPAGYKRGWPTWQPVYSNTYHTLPLIFYMQYIYLQNQAYICTKNQYSYMHSYK